ncbi:MAG: MBL fold metallo-hydrolase, partial [Nitrospinota bacterium]|nr:MBL fold metallo-hydrolase [Nitrospinota bacterium]
YASRGLFDLNHRLWLSWTISGMEKRVFISGDSGYFDGFKEVGKKLGPMDVTFLKIGAYNDKGTWRKLHMTPEEAVAEHIDLSGGVMVPLHWATFDLALHSWYEPMERAMAEAKRLGVNIATPKVGQVVLPDGKTEIEYWWRAEEKPE